MGRYFTCGAAVLAMGAGVLAIAPGASAITKQQMLQALGASALHPSAATTTAAAYVGPAPLSSGILDQVGGGGPGINLATLSHPQWVALYDPTPCVMWEHPASILLIDDVTGVVTTLAVNNWPTINGIALGDGTGTMTNLIRVYPMLPLPGPSAPALGRSVPGQWGDAPDGTAAYVGVLGQFPTKPTSTTGAVGIRYRLPNLETFGVLNSVERGPTDPADPDGRPNLVDGDTGPRMFLAWDPNGATATGYLIYDVTVSAKAIATTRYVNFLADFNRNGQWNRPGGGPNEWAVLNQAVVVPPGTSKTFCSPGFAWGTGAPSSGPFLLWGRAALSRTPLPPFPGGWDGSGAYIFGDVHDYCIQLRTCPQSCTLIEPPRPGDPEPDPGGGGGPPPPHPKPPAPPVGWDGTPVKFIAIVIAGKDHPGDAFVAGSAASMGKFLTGQGWTVSSLTGAGSNAAGVCAAIAAAVPSLKCQDKVLIYICAHGRKMTAGGLMRMGDGSAMTGPQFDACLDLIPPCPNEICSAPGCCNVTVIVESCYSGQVQTPLAGVGRTVITTTSSDHPAWATPSSGVYTAAFQKCSQSAAADTDGDGHVSPAEAGACAAAMLPPTPEPQVPTQSNNKCPCVCPVPVGGGCSSMPLIAGDGIFAYDTALIATGAFGQSTSQCLFSGQIGIAHDNWFRWIAPYDGVATMTTCGLTGQDSKCAVYDTPTCGGVGGATCLACNDDDSTCSSNTLASTLRFSCVANHQYLLQVGTFPGSAQIGPSLFRMGTTPQPFNNACDSFFDVFFSVSLDGIQTATATFDNSTAQMTSQGQLPGPCTMLTGPQMSRSLWYDFTAPMSGNFTATACMLSTGTLAKLKIYQFPLGMTCDALGPPIACAEGQVGCVGGSATIPAIEGQRYLVQVGTPVGAPGAPGTLTITGPTPTCTIGQVAGGPIESEPCGGPAHLNDGCAYPGDPRFEQIPIEIVALGLTSSQPFGIPPAPDADWWLLQPSAPGMYTVGLVSETGRLSAQIFGGVGPTCSPLQSLGTLTANKCAPAYMTVLNPMPALIVAVGPPQTTVSCTGGNHYNLQIMQASTLAPCCLPLRECVVIDQQGCAEQGGAWRPSSGACSPGVCPNPCRPDYNNDGVISIQDIFDFLAAWFAGNPLSDFNGSGTLTIQDIFDFLAAWFAGCNT